MRAAFAYDVDAASLEAGLECRDKTLTVQSQKDETDINTIVKRFGLTGELPVIQRVPLQVDLDDLLDYRQCMDYVIAGQKSFDSLPAGIRSRFENDHVAFVEWAVKPENLEELRSLGLAPPAPQASSPAPDAAGGREGGGGSEGTT